MKTVKPITELPWDNEPINLPVECINDPFRTVAEFYSSNTLPDFKKLLQQWLLAGLEDEHKWDYPELLKLIHSFHDMKQLVEALFLVNKTGITVDPKKGDIRVDKDDPLDINWSSRVLDRLEWNNIDQSEFYTPLLSREEEANPYLVVNKTFELHTLKEIRSGLEFWFHTALTNPWEYKAMDNLKMVKLYNLMDRLIEAGFVISELYLLNKGE